MAIVLEAFTKCYPSALSFCMPQRLQLSYDLVTILVTLMDTQGLLCSSFLSLLWFFGKGF